MKFHPWQAALLRLSERLERPVDDVAASIVRVDVDAEGRMTLELAPELSGRGPCWFRFDGDALEPALCAEDSRLPLATEWATRAMTGAELLGYRPGRRIVVGLEDGCVVKGYRRRRSSDPALRHRLAALAARACEEADGQYESFETARLEEHDEKRDTLVFERLRGARPSLAEGSLFFRVGSALRGWQQYPVGDELPEHGPAEELVVLLERGRRLELVQGSLPPEWERATEELAGWIDCVRPERLALAHRDLHDGQLLVAGPSIRVLDFDLLCRADAALDVANLAAHTMLRALQSLFGATEESALEASRALLDGLDRSDEPDFARRLRFYQAATFLRLAAIYALRPSWGGLAPTLVALARRSLGDLQRA